MPPKQQDSEVAYQHFPPDERLFRRIQPFHVSADGQISPLALSFQRPLSTLRSNEAVPADAIHPDCAAGHEVSEFRVMSFPVSALPESLEAGDGRIFSVFPNHKPEPTCFAHTNVWCLDSTIPVDREREIPDEPGSAVYKKSPPNKVKAALKGAILGQCALHEATAS